MRLKFFRAALIGLAVAVATGGFASAGALKRLENFPVVKEESQKRLSECISKNHELSVLFLVDESMSLRNTSKGIGSDPDNRRVDGIRAAIAGLAASTSIDEKTKIKIQFVGFGSSSNKRSAWTEITDSGKLDLVASEFEKFNNDVNTDYIAGLDTALSEFVTRNDDLDRPNCKLLVWLTDGVYDMDNDPKLSTGELKDLNGKLCNDGGIVDNLRELGVTVVAIGLSNIASKSIPDFSWLEKVTGETSGCGKLQANGWFIPVSDADALVDELFKGVTTPSPEDLGVLTECADKPIDCTEIAFNVTAFITTFQVLVQPQIVKSAEAASKIKVSMIAPENQYRVEVLPKESSNSVFKIKKLNESRALVRVDFTQEASNYWVGDWRIRFDGPGALNANALAVFLSDYKVSLADEQEAVIDRVKSRTQPIKLVLVSSLIPTPSDQKPYEVVPEIKAVVKLASPVTLGVKNTSQNNFEIAKEDLITLFKDPNSEPSLVSSIWIEFTPQVQINGMPIVFGPQQINFVLRDGDKYPSVKVLGVAKIDKSDTAIVKLKLIGPQQGTGIVKVTPVVLSVSGAPDQKTIKDFSVSGVEQECKVAEDSESDDCQFQVSANFEANFELTLNVQAEIRNEGDKSGSWKKISLSVPVRMTKPINPTTTFWAALGLVLLFVVVQLLLRLGFAVAMSRFEPLPISSRRVSKQIMLSSNGKLLNADGRGFAIRNEETELVFDMDKPFRKLSVDGFELSVSLMKTFITQKPKGMVFEKDKYVFGSLGLNSEKEVGVGIIALTPRGQWAIAVTKENLLLLANDEPAVIAKMIIFFDDILLLPLDQQVSELVDRINTSSFASDLAALLEDLKSSSSGRVDSQAENESRNVKYLETDQIKKEETKEEHFDPNDPLN